MLQVELSAVGLIEFPGAHGRPVPDAIDLLPVELIIFTQKQRSARTLTLTCPQEIVDSGPS